MKEGKVLRRGWTTGACAAGAARAAFEALSGRDFPDPVPVLLPKGLAPAFPLAHRARGEDWAEAGIIKDAGDDPDVTHGALVTARVERMPPGSGLIFAAGTGVGRVTLPGLPLAVGEPAINPGPRAIIAENLRAAAAGPLDLKVTVSIPDGEKRAEKTLNARLGILGGLSILGTTGVVIPYSCAAWIHALHRGIDVARAAGLSHVAGATGKTSEEAARRRFDLPETALIDMGDFVGGFLKYLRRHPVPRVTIAGGFAKLTKLAQGRLDLHSKEGRADLGRLGDWLRELGAAESVCAAARSANTANQALAAAGDLPLGRFVAQKALAVAREALANDAVALDIMIVDRSGKMVGHAD